MGWLRTVSEVFATRARKAADTVDHAISLVPAFWTQVVWAISSTYPELAKLAFGSNAIVYACMRLLCQSVAEPPLVASTEDAKGELTPLPKAHPLAVLLRRPNELMTEYEMLELIELHTGLSGGSYWWKQRTNGGQVAALWPLRPDRVVPIYNPKLDAPEGERVIRGWAYFPPGEGRPIPLPRSEVLAFGNPNPAGETGGIVETLGWVQVLASEIAGDNAATKLVGSLLANYAQPSMLIKTKAPIRDKDTAKRLKAQFMAELGGSHAGEPALLDADTTIEKLSFTLRELEFPDVRAVAETRVAAAAGVPAMLVGLKAGMDRAIQSNVDQFREFFADTTLSVKWRRYQDQFSNDLAPEFGPGIVIRFDTSKVKALAGQRQRDAQPIKEGFERGVVFLDEYREKVLGLTPLPNNLGQVLYLPTNVKVVTPDDLLKKPEPPALLPPVPPNALPPGQPDPEDDDPDLDEDDEPQQPPPARKAVRAAGDTIQKRADATRDRHAKALTSSIRAHLDGQRASVVASWNETAKAWPDPESLVPDDDEALASILRDGWELILGDAVDDAGEALGVTLSFDLENDWVQASLDGVGERVRGITQTTRDDLKGIIGRAASEGLGVQDVAAAIRDAFAFGESRAETIALTEMATAYNTATLRSYEDSGLVDSVEVLDGDGDETCKALNGQVKSLAWARSNLIQHPRCRRAFAPVLRDA